MTDLVFGTVCYSVSHTSVKVTGANKRPTREDAAVACSAMSEVILTSV